MGFRFRKSINAGPFRVNLSKSGVGWSVGGKGFRYTQKANGGTRTTASIPGTGVSYTKETGAKSTQSSHSVDTEQAYFVDGILKNKWASFLLCLFLGYIGAHKYYEGKISTGLLYTCTFGLFGIGWIIDCIVLFFKPNPYVV